MRYARPVTSRRRTVYLAPAAVVAVLLAAGGCAAAASGTRQAAHEASVTASAPLVVPGTVCGQSKTPGGFIEQVRVIKGRTTCPAALKVFNDYWAAVVAGKAPGNGGGGPVSVDGFVCQSPPATETGHVPSKCVSNQIEVDGNVTHSPAAPAGSL